MGKHTYTEDEKRKALEIYATDGPSEAARHIGADKASVTRWAKAAGLTTLRTEKTRAATEARLATVAERKAQLASDLLDDADQLRRQIFAPCVERKAMVVSDGHLEGGHVEIVEIDREHPTFAEQRQVVTSVAIIVDKVQLLTGEATARIESGPTPERTPEQEQELAKVIALAERRAG